MSLTAEPIGFALVLAQALERASQLRHGGTIAILDAPESAPVDLTYRAASRAIKDHVDRFYRAWLDSLRISSSKIGLSPGGMTKG